MTAGSTCPICSKERKDLLAHLRLDHDITGIPDFMRGLQTTRERAEVARQFRAYIRELTAQRESGKISPEEFRRLASNWHISKVSAAGTEDS